MANANPAGDRVSYQLTLEKPGTGTPALLVADRPITIPTVGDRVDLFVEDGQQFSGTVSAVKRQYNITSGVVPKLTCGAWVTLS